VEPVKQLLYVAFWDFGCPLTPIPYGLKQHAFNTSAVIFGSVL